MGRRSAPTTIAIRSMWVIVRRATGGFGTYTLSIIPASEDGYCSQYLLV